MYRKLDNAFEPPAHEGTAIRMSRDPWRYGPLRRLSQQGWASTSGVSSRLGNLRA